MATLILIFSLTIFGIFLALLNKLIVGTDILYFYLVLPFYILIWFKQLFRWKKINFWV